MIALNILKVDIPTFLVNAITAAASATPPVLQNPARRQHQENNKI
jgi:hypothetical protein